jgi:hypothetical protein
VRHALLRNAQLALAALALAFATTAPVATAHDAPMPADAPHGRLIDERWVMLHWGPFDEHEAEHALGLSDGGLEGYLYNDHHTLAQLARSRGVAFEPLVDRLAGWAEGLSAHRRAIIRQRIRLTLVSGHLAQHVLYHVFHGTHLTAPIKVAAGKDQREFAASRAGGASSSALVAAGGHDPVALEQALAQQLTTNGDDGVAQGETPQSEATRLLARQQSQLHCWFTRPLQRLDPSAPYGRAYLLHADGHTSPDVPTTRAAQALEDRAITSGLKGRPAGCWAVPQPFTGDPGAPLTRRELRRLARVPGGFRGPVNGPGSMTDG